MSVRERRVAVMTGVDETTLETRPLAAPGRGEVVVEVRSVGVCGSDVHWYRDGRIGDTVVSEPLVLGHEAAGVIVEVGEGVDPARAGERVAIEPGRPCRVCAECSAGRYNLCTQMQFFATPPVDGAFATHVVVDETLAHAVPASLSDDEAALVEPLAVALWAVRKAGVGIGDRVLVTGAGPVGLLAVQVAVAAGAVVDSSDPSPLRRAAALRFGARRGLDPREDAMSGYSVLIECSGMHAAIDSGIRSLDAAGRAVLVGMARDAMVPVPLDVIQSRELAVTGTFRYANAYPDAIALAASGRVRVGELVTSTHALSGVHDALLRPGTDPAALKPMVHPQHHESSPA